MALSQGGKSRALCRETATACCSAPAFWHMSVVKRVIHCVSVSCLCSGFPEFTCFLFVLPPLFWQARSSAEGGPALWLRHREGYLLSVGALAPVFQSYREELEREQASRARVQQDLDEATQRLLMAQEEIRRLTDELDAQRKEQNKIGKCFSCGRVPLLITGLHLAHPWLAYALDFSPRGVGGRLSCVLSACHVQKSVSDVSLVPRRLECSR